MTLHDKRPARLARALAGGVLAASLSVACQGTGSILDSAQDPSSPGFKPTGVDGTPGQMGGGAPPSGSGILPNPPAGDPQAACESKEFTPARVWRLTDDQYLNAVKDLVPGVTPKTILTPGRSAQQFIDFAEAFDIGPSTTSDIRGSVTALAADAVKNVDALLACKTGEDAQTCANRFIEGFASRAFRRPLEAVEKDGLKALYAEGAAVSKAEGVRMVLSAVLQSGSFLYRTELGKMNSVGPGQTVELTPHELASSLSFLLLNSIPDPELRAAADDGSLMNKDVFKAQVERLLKSPKVQDNLTTVYLKWVGLGLGLNADLATQEKEFTPELKASLEQEAGLFMKEMLTKGTVTDLLTSNKGFVDGTLARHFGVQGAGGTGFSPTTYPADQRAGVLTLGGVVARYSLGHAEVFRGKFVRDEFLCMEIPPPPNIPEIEEETKASENLTTRQQSERRLANATCGGCHSMMDPIGLSFGNYDALGRFRTMDKQGKPIDASGKLTDAGMEADGPVKNVVELGQRMARSPKVRNCIETQMLGYALGRLTGDIDTCELSKIDAFTQAGGGKLSDLMAAVVYSSAFRYRTGGK